jgi:hypothetical protein
LEVSVEYTYVYIAFLWANYESRNAWVWVWDPDNRHGNQLNRWFRLRDDNFDTVQNMLMTATMAKATGRPCHVVAGGESGNDPNFATSRIEAISIFTGSI